MYVAMRVPEVMPVVLVPMRETALTAHPGGDTENMTRSSLGATRIAESAPDERVGFRVG